METYGTAIQATGNNTIRCMCRAMWITKATVTHAEYVILIAFLRQQWLRERASMSHLYVHFLFCCNWDRVVCEVRNVPKHFADIWIAVFDLVFLK